MKKLLGILGVIFLASCETSDTCHCEIFENIGTDNEPQLRFIGSTDGSCEDKVKDEKYIYQSVSCE